MKSPENRRAFTLVELLVVISIIALLAALGLPAIKTLTNSNKSAGAVTQLANDLKLARSKAIVGRTTVYVVFVPTNFTGLALSTPASPTAADNAIRTRNLRLIEKLLTQKYTSYALFAERRVGDQPGRPSLKYITPWRSLPEGSFVAQAEFDRLNSVDDWKKLAINAPTTLPGGTYPYRPLPYGQFPFPSDSVDCPAFDLPYLAFNHLGQLVVPFYKPPNGPQQPVTGAPDDLVVHLAQGSIFYARDDATGKLINETEPPPPFQDADVLETPPGNSTNLWVRVNWLTGRAHIGQPEIVD